MLNIGRVKIHRPKTERRGAPPSEPRGSDGLVWGIIITAGGQASWSLIKTVALQLETRTIPIVYPVASGIVARLDRPSGNITGFANLEPSLGGKWLELLSEIAPGLKRASIMFNPNTAPVSAFRPSLETAALQQIIASVQSDVEIEAAIIALGREPGGGLVVHAGCIIFMFAQVHRASIISAAARNNIPAVYYLSDFARDGRVAATPGAHRGRSREGGAGHHQAGVRRSAPGPAIGLAAAPGARQTGGVAQCPLAVSDSCL